MFIDASNEYKKVTNNNKLGEKNIDKIISAFVERVDIEGFAKCASYDEVEDQNYNLSVSSYIENIYMGIDVDIEKINERAREIAANVNKLRDDIEATIREMEGKI